MAKAMLDDSGEDIIVRNIVVVDGKLKLCLNFEELQSAIGVGEHKARELIHRKDFPVIWNGRSPRIPIDLLHEWVLRNVGEEI